tara:strand:+ start:3735 stop:4238 length:504 start_codon:yes stop_codon:yes gene_type:complete
MATLDLTKVWSADEVLTHTDLNGNFAEIETFLNAANLDTDNISTKYVTTCYTFTYPAMPATASKTYNFTIKLPSGSTPVGQLKPKTFSVFAPVTTGTLTVTLLAGSTPVVTRSITSSSLDSTESFLVSTIDPASELTLRFVTSNPFAFTGDDIVTVAFHALTEIRSS